MTSIAVVTPFWNTPELAPAYWRALSVAAEDDRSVIIDNGSDIPTYFEDAVIVNETNVGFSPACNQGLRWAADNEVDAVLFLNSDVVMQSTSWLEEIRKALRPGRLVGSDLKTEWYTRVDGKIHPYLDGWCLAGMTADLLDLGGWDEDFEEPSYSGDVDLCFRAKLAGMKLVTAPVGLRHLSNHTSRQLDVRGVSERNFARFAAKVRNALGTVAA